MADAPFTATEQPPSVIGSRPGATQSPAIVWGQRSCPKMVAKEPGAIGCAGSKDAPFTTVIWADAMPRLPEMVSASRTNHESVFFITCTSMDRPCCTRGQSATGPPFGLVLRSEEHTSELQSPMY